MYIDLFFFHFNKMKWSTFGWIALVIFAIVLFTGFMVEQKQLQNTFFSKEHPAFEYYPGIKDSRDWMFPNTEGYYPSFFSFWKKGISTKNKN